MCVRVCLGADAVLATASRREDFRRTSGPFNVTTVGTLGVGSKTKVYIL